MSKILRNGFLLLALRIVIGFIFIYAGMEKIADPESFSKAVYNYKLFPDFLINFIAIAIPWIEVVSGILLIFGLEIKANASIISALLFLFVVIILISLIRGLNIDCGCFGGSSPVAWNKILENILMLIGSVIIIIFSEERLLIYPRGVKKEL